VSEEGTGRPPPAARVHHLLNFILCTAGLLDEAAEKETREHMEYCKQ
jgi:hypothetical protein